MSYGLKIFKLGTMESLLHCLLQEAMVGKKVDSSAMTKLLFRLACTVLVVRPVAVCIGELTRLCASYRVTSEFLLQLHAKTSMHRHANLTQNFRRLFCGVDGARVVLTLSHQ